MAVGRDAGEEPNLRRLADDLGVADRVIWAGTRVEMPAVYSAMDIHLSTSQYSEGTPNVVGEAMACGVPCVATDIGDCAIIVAGTGTIVPPRDPEGVAAAVDALLLEYALERTARSRACRARVVAEFEVDAVAARFGDAWRRIARGEPACA